MQRGWTVCAVSGRSAYSHRFSPQGTEATPRHIQRLRNIPRTRSIVAQRSERVDLQGAAGRQDGGECGGNQEQGDDAEVSCDVQIADPEEASAQELRERGSAADPGDQPRGHRDGELAQHHGEHLRGARPQRHADADFTSPLSNGIRHHAQDAETGEELGDPPSTLTASVVY